MERQRWEDGARKRRQIRDEGSTALDPVLEPKDSFPNGLHSETLTSPFLWPLAKILHRLA